MPCSTPPATRGSVGNSPSAARRWRGRSPPPSRPGPPSESSAGAEGELAQLLEVLGLVLAGAEHDIVEAPFAETMQALAGDVARTFQVTRIVRTVRARGGAIELHHHVGDDGALAAEIAKARDPFAQRPPAAARARADPAVEIAGRPLDPLRAGP